MGEGAREGERRGEKQTLRDSDWEVGREKNIQRERHRMRD